MLLGIYCNIKPPFCCLKGNPMVHPSKVLATKGRHMLPPVTTGAAKFEGGETLPSKRPNGEVTGLSFGDKVKWSVFFLRPFAHGQTSCEWPRGFVLCRNPSETPMEHPNAIKTLCKHLAQKVLPQVSNMYIYIYMSIFLNLLKCWNRKQLKKRGPTLPLAGHVFSQR